MNESEQLVMEGALLTITFTDYQRHPEYVSIQSVEHAGVDITLLIDDGVIGRALIKKLNAVADEMNDSAEAAKFIPRDER